MCVCVFYVHVVFINCWSLVLVYIILIILDENYTFHFGNLLKKKICSAFFLSVSVQFIVLNRIHYLFSLYGNFKKVQLLCL